MKDTRVTRDDKTDGGVLCPFGQSLCRGVRAELHLSDDTLDSLGYIFIDSGDFIEDTGYGGDRYIGPAGNISYAYFFFHLIEFHHIADLKLIRFVLDIRSADIPTDLDDLQGGYFI
jgi:hypothetical protein